MIDGTPVCLDCATQVTRRASGRGRHPIRCEPCRKARQRKLWREKAARQYDVRRAGPKGLACTANPAPGRQCETCQRGIDHKRADATFCSTYCRDWWRMQTRAVRRCTRCPALAGKDSPYCWKCSAAVKRTSNRTTRMRRLGLRAGRYLLADVAERSGYVCHLCDRPVDMDLSGMDPQGPTVDHIIPVSRGGTDDLANVALAHRLCNTRRGVKPVEVARRALVNA